MTCDGYTTVWELVPREVISLDGARGATLRVTRGRVWLTQERDARDIVLDAGDAFTIECGGRTVVEALEGATLCLPVSRQSGRNRQARRMPRRIPADARSAP
jgi:hypothetical protein